MKKDLSKKDQLNIAMVGHKRVASREGGVEIVVSELATRMVQKGNHVTCYDRGGHHVSGEEYDDPSVDNYHGVHVKKLWTIEGKGLAAASSSIFGAIVTAFGKYDVVHFHAEGPCLACGIPKFFGKKVIATIHGLDHQRAKWGRFATAYIMRGEKAAVRHADEIIVLSKGVQDYFKDRYHRETVLIPNGIEKAKPEEADLICDKWGLKKDDYILFLGRVVPEKGVHYLIEAYEGLNTDKKLVIAGGASDTSDYLERLYHMAEAIPDETESFYKSTDGKIIFTGFVQGQPLAELYSNAYVYVLPSDLEGMPLSLLEAMSYGNCCLTSDIPECADVTGKQGVTFRKSDVEDLREKMDMLLKDEMQTDLLKSYASDYICDKYNWNDVVDKTLKLYKGIYEE